MLLWLVLGCSDNQNGTEPQAESENAIQQASNTRNQSSKGSPSASPTKKQNQLGPNGQPIHKGPQHNPKNGVPGQPPNGMPVGQNMGMGGTQPESFHAEVTFEWTTPQDTWSKQSKSIILISLDTVHAQRMSIYGGPAQVPNLQRFSENGVVFEKAISHFPETALSHWTMMSSVLPEVHGNVPANGGSLYTGPTLADIAKVRSYRTGGFIGGVTMTDQASGFGRGFDEYDDQFAFSFEDMSRDGTEVTERTVQWISKQKGTSYFAFAHYFDAHFPYTPTNNLYDPEYTGIIDGTDAVLRPYRDGQKIPSQRDIQHVLALYDAEITELDAKIAPLLKLADDNTIVVVTADHGESFSHDYYFNHRAGLWDEVTHVPLIIGGGGLKGARVSQQIGLIDVLPTVLDLAGLPSDQRFMGTSRVNWIETGTGIAEHVYSITDPWMPGPQFSVRTPVSKWIDGIQQDWVYDLESDPEESNNLKTIPPSLLASKETYQKLVTEYAKWQSVSPRKRQISDEECKRLMALGYTTCGQ